MGKRLLYLLSGIVLFFLSGPVQSAPVSRKSALEMGRKILEGPATRADASRVRILWDGAEPDGTADEPAFYVIGREDGGFVIIAGNDNVQPVLALSETNRFETRDMPDNVRWWMDRLKAYVRSARTGTAETKALWAALKGTRAGAGLVGTVTGKVEHLTPEWDQGSFDDFDFGQPVFNRFCPKDAGGRLTVTGCTATAAAEILTTLSGLYPEDMPEKGNGKVGGYPVSAGRVAPAGYELSTVYDWAGLRTLTGQSAIRQAIADGKKDLIDNLGHLLADCGAIVQASYGTDETSASPDIAAGMVGHMSMSKTSHFESATDYSLFGWVGMLKADLADRPVFYTGYSGGGGHAFVLDGFGQYEGQDVFHVNFGWSGLGNGYYFINHLDTGTGDYSAMMSAVFGFYPDARQLTGYRTELLLTSPGFTLPESVSAGNYLFFKGGRLFNNSLQPFSGELHAGLKKRDGSEETFFPGYYGTITDLHYGGRFSTDIFFCYIPEDTVFGFGDRITLYYTTDGGEHMTPVSYRKNGSAIGEIPVFPAAVIDTENRYRAGDSFEFSIVNYDGLYAGTTWTVTDPGGGVSTLSQADGAFRFARSGKYTIEAAIAPEPGADVVEHLVTVIVVQ